MVYLYSPIQKKCIRRNKKIILFKTIDEAYAFFQQFIQYALTRMMTENPFLMGDVLAIGQHIQVIEFLPENSGIKEDETILFDDLKK